MVLSPATCPVLFSREEWQSSQATMSLSRWLLWIALQIEVAACTNCPDHYSKQRGPSPLEQDLGKDSLNSKIWLKLQISLLDIGRFSLQPVLHLLTQDRCTTLNLAMAVHTMALVSSLCSCFPQEGSWHAASEKGPGKFCPLWALLHPG